MTHIVDGNAHVAPPGAAAGGHARSDRIADATAEELLAYMREAGVDQAALVPHPPGSFDNAYCIDSARRYPESFIATAKVDAADPSAPEQVEAFAREPAVGGLRFEYNGAGASLEWIIERECGRLWEAAHDSGLPVALPGLRRRDQLPPVRGLLERMPSLRLILLHGLDSLMEEAAGGSTAGEDLLSLADFAGVYLGVTERNLAQPADQETAGRAPFQAALGRFGAARMLWTSFFPARAPADAPLRGLLDPVRTGLAALPQRDQDLILGGTARSLFPALCATRNAST